MGRRRLKELETRLSSRDRAILVAVEQLHYLSAGQIERLLFPVGPLTPLAATRSSRRSLRRLHDLGLLDRLDRQVGGVRAGSGAYIYTLSPLGARLLQTPTRRRSREPSLLHLDHVLAVAELAVRLHEAARNGRIDQLQIETEPDCWRPVTLPHGGRALLKPDLRVTLLVRDQELHWFVEQDNATEHRPALIRKCQAYRQAWVDGRVEAELGIFPRVLWIVPTQRRASFIQTAIASANDLPAGMFAVTTTEQAIDSLIGLEGGGL